MNRIAHPRSVQELQYLIKQYSKSKYRRLAACYTEQFSPDVIARKNVITWFEINPDQFRRIMAYTNKGFNKAKKRLY